jgi:voltage-gated potassium channel
MSEHHPPKSRKLLPGVFRYSVASFLAGLVMLIFAAPFMADVPGGRMIESALLTLVLIFAVLAVGHHRRMLLFAVLLLLPTVTGRWLYHFFPGQMSPVLFLVSAIIFVIFIISQLLYFILRAPRVDSEVLCAGVSTYLLLGLLWAFAYMLVANTVKNAFMIDGQISTGMDMTSFSSVYFSLVTLTTVGYGDIVPNCSVARMLASMEAMTGTMFMAVMISRLVSLYSRQPPETRK